MPFNDLDFTNVTTNVPHQAAWLVYINGLEIPVVDVNIDFGVWNIPEATLQLIPHTILQRIGFEDRLQVQLFYLDEFYDTSNPQFKLFHEYEVIGWSFTNTGTGRYVQLNCRSQLQIMEQLFFYYMSAVDDMVVAKSPATVTDGSLFTDSMVYYPYSLFLHGLVRLVKDSPTEVSETVDQSEFIRSPFEFIANVFRALLSPIDITSQDNTAVDGKIPSSAASCPGRNFFGRWMNMTDFNRRWAGLPVFDDVSAEGRTEDGCFPLLKAVRNTEVLTAVQRQLGDSIGHAGSMWDLLKTIFNVLYYEINSIPAPPAVELETTTGLLLGPIKTGSKGEVIRNNKAGKSFGGIMSNIAKPQCLFGIPPTCNIIFPSMVSSLSFQENYMQQPTRLYLGEQFMSNVLTAKAEGAVQALAAEAVTTGYPVVVQNRMRLYVTDPKQNTKNFLVYPEELFKGPVSTRASAPPWLYMLNNVSASITKTSGGSSSGGFSSGFKVLGKTKMKKIANTRELIGPTVKKYASKYSLPVDFIYGIIWTESRYQLNALSPVGARGLMQVMPNTAKGIWNKIRKKEGVTAKFSEINYTDIDHIIHIGTFLFRKYADEFGYPMSIFNLKSLDNTDKNRTPLEIVIAAYNWNPSGARKMKKAVEKAMARNVAAGKPATPTSTWAYNQTGQADNYIKEVIHGWKLSQSFSVPPDDNPFIDLSATEQPEVPVEPDSVSNNIESLTGQSIESASVEEVQESTEALGFSDYGAATLGPLFDLYAKYEFYRMRFESRKGGVSLAFNPYIVPGFPAIVFDEESSGFDTVGYVTNVKHHMTSVGGSPQMSTQVSMAYMRTFAEFIQHAIQGFEEAQYTDTPYTYEVGPAEPIPAVGETFQIHGGVEGSPAGAHEFYGQLLYPGVAKDAISGWDPVFDWRKMMVLYDAEDNALEGRTVAYEDGLTARPNRRYFREFRSYDAAMAYIARPACTLQQFIELRHGKPLKTLLEEATRVVGTNYSFHSDMKSKSTKGSRGGAVFWDRIDMLTQGPGSLDPEVVKKITNTDGPPDFAPYHTGKWHLINTDAGVPQTRRDWDKMLRLYRKVVYGAKRHLAPQV